MFLFVIMLQQLKFAKDNSTPTIQILTQSMCQMF